MDLGGVSGGSSADAIVFCAALGGSFDGLRVVRAEVAAAGIDKPAILAATKADDAPAEALARLAIALQGLEVVPVSVLDDESLDRLREAIWQLTGLIRVYPKHNGKVDEEPFALPLGATIAEVADEIHHELGADCAGALVWGKSARFDGQRVGRGHVVADGDVVEIIV